ncbi:hypothetical protein GCM10010390_17400 [Streptomyces mordarskii]|uniref:Uncharacterized protein n=1 Tax=Streptomyces mordarskii TaxID=1226758 RepID=A0ABP3MB58_9ACTN
MRPRNGVTGLGLGRFLLDGTDLALVIEADHAICSGVGNRIGEHPGSLDAGMVP